ncbi:MAG: DNA-processing protein DprA [Treponema sp.]|nr:DNA-processing protein DprA [Treponema sp.]
MAGNAMALVDLMICRIPGLTGRQRIELGGKFDTEDDFLVRSKKDIENILGTPPSRGPWTMAGLRAAGEADAAAAKRYGIGVVSWREGEYPPLLRETYNPPALLFYRGALPDPEKPLVAVVGTRKPSSHAAERAFALGRELGEAGLPVVSGLALGIDAMAHRGNIEGGAATVAVLGSGPDCVYPASNRGLARRVVETGGALLSEYPPGTMPRKWNFPARNRIISALARGTVLVQAPENSGALITARFALEQGRDLWVDRAGLALPGGAGTARLAGEGAVIIDSASDILAEWNMDAVTRKDSPGTTAGKNMAGDDLASSLAEYLQIKL